MVQETNDQGQSNSQPSGITSRRNYLRVGASLVTAGFFAGCTGDGGDGGGTTPTDTPSGDGGTTPTDTPSGDGGTTPTLTSSDGTDLSGVSIRIWAANGRHSTSAGNHFRNAAKQFEQQTGANVKVNIPPSVFGSPQKWLSTFKNGDQPVLFEEGHYVMGQILRPDWVLPADDGQGGGWIKDIDAELMQNYEWLMGTMERAHSGTSVRSWGLPYDFLTYSPLMARADLLEQAGVRSDWPPETYDEYVSMGYALQNDSDAEFGIGIHGGSESMDSGVNLLSMGFGGFPDGAFIKEDWSGINTDNDTWKEAIRKHIAIYREEQISPPNTPNHTVEKGIPEITQGFIGMQPMEVLNFPQVMQQGGSMVANKQIIWGKSPSDTGKFWNSPGMWCISKKPSNVDSAKWERKQEAAKRFVEFFLQKEQQQGLFENIGYLPGHQEVAEARREDYHEHHLYNVVYQQMQNSPAGYSVHPALPFFMFSEGYQPVVNGLKGDLSPSEVNQQMTQIGNDLVEQYSGIMD